MHTSRHCVVPEQEIIDFHVNKEVYMAKIKLCKCRRTYKLCAAMYKFALEHTDLKGIVGPAASLSND